jgi:hypothetical protein
MALDNISLVEEARAKWLREAVGMSNRKGESDNEPLRVDVEQSHRMSELTIAHYDRLAEAYWDGTREHDVNWKSRQRGRQIGGSRCALAMPRRFWAVGEKLPSFGYS